MFASHCETLFLILFTLFLLFQLNCGLSLHKNSPLDNNVLGSSEVNTNFPVHGNGRLVRYFLVGPVDSWRGDFGKFKTDEGRFDRKINFRRDTDHGDGRFMEEVDGQKRIIDDYNEANKYIQRHRRQATETPPKAVQSTKSTSTEANSVREPRFGRYWKHRHRPHHGHFGRPYVGSLFGYPPFGPLPGPPPYPGPGPWQGGAWEGPGDADEEYEYGDGFDMHHNHHHCGGDHGSDGKKPDGKPSKGEGSSPDGNVKPVYEDSTEDPNDNTKFGVELLTPITKTTETTKVPDIDIRFRVKDK